jgi:plasmid replication initiation protein
MAQKYILAFYELDRCYGGPEEGGWWYDVGQYVRPLAIVANEEQAYKLANRANDLLDFLQRKKRGIGSMAYSGGRHRVEVYLNEAPKYWPEVRPHYE